MDRNKIINDLTGVEVVNDVIVQDRLVIPDLNMEKLDRVLRYERRKGNNKKRDGSKNSGSEKQGGGRALARTAEDV